MKAPTVRLYLRVHLPTSKKDAFLEPCWNRNRSLRVGYALVDKQPVHHPAGCYYLRYRCHGKTIWESVGRQADAALVAYKNKERELQAISLGFAAVPQPPAEPAQQQVSNSPSLKDAIQVYLSEVRRFRSPKTIAACQYMLSLFGSRFSNRSVADITREDLLDHMSHLKSSGSGDRTVHNHIMRICTLLKRHGVVGLLSGADKPKYEEKDVEAYNSDQLLNLFRAATPEERILFEFFLGTGMREQEVMYTSWKNIDFKSKVVAVRSKPEMGFLIKDKEERSVPVPDSLIASLLERKNRSTLMLVFPGSGGKPDGHFLRMLHKLALRAGLNCGECMTKGGKSCATHAVCGEWGLHKFRKTFATMHNDAGVTVTTIQKWLGHSDLATTLRYLAVADLRSERTRCQVNASFACLALDGAA